METDLCIFFSLALLIIIPLSYQIGYMAGWDKGIQDGNKIRDK